MVDWTSFQVPIKAYPTGKFTKNIENWSLGSQVEWIGPFVPPYGDWLKNSSSLQCFAAGTGIAPFLRIIESLLEDDNCEMRIQLVFCVRSGKDILFKEALDRWTKHWNFSLVIVTSSQEVAVCGSKSFEKDVINFAKRGGLPESQLFRFPG